MRQPVSSIVSKAPLAALVLAGATHVGAAEIDPCTQTTSPGGGTPYSSDGRGGNNAGGNYELWHDGQGSMKMTVYGKDAAFKAEWDNAGDFLARVGYFWGDGQGYSSYGNVIADYNFTKSGTGGGYSYIGIYGWSKSPLVEYYIVENGLGSYPPNASALGGAQTKGTLTVDGETYDIYTFTRKNAPNILGKNQDFPQFWSVRRKARTCGRISVSEHWKKWEAVGMKLGNMYEAKLLVEAGGGKGSFDLTYGKMQINVTSLLSAQTVTGQGILGNGKAGTLSLVGLDGKVIMSTLQTESEPARLSTSGLAKGMYIARFQAPGAAPETQKVLVQ